MRQVDYIFIATFMLLQSVCLPAQTVRAFEQMERGDSLRVLYRFSEAVEAYEDAYDSFVDSLMTADDSILRLDISDRLLMAQNGRSMMDFVYIPDVVARHKFPIDEFFLYYPLPEGAWRQVPSQLDSIAHEFSKATYVLDGEDEMYWSAVDKSGVRNIYRSVYQDTVWSVPALLNEHMTSASDEIYPMLSPDGKRLYFSTAGLYGIGGYDIYVSEWDDDARDWSVPVNMGFPYSSPADDFLFAASDDGRYNVFASNRDCSKDSVWVYVLAHEDMPVRHAVADPDELRAIAALDPGAKRSDENTQDVQADIPENVDTRRYMDKMSEVRELRDSIDRLGMEIEDARFMNDEEAVLDGEFALISLRDSLARASAILQQIEMEFLFSGVVIDPDKLLAEADREIVGHTVDYEFTRRDFGAPLDLKMLEPEPEFDYSFKILEEGQFAEDNTIPEGLVYQIQMFSSTAPATVAKLKGLSPVFESRTASGRYVYSVGVFRSHSDVLENLNAVKKAGFRNAFIVAFNDGKEIAVSKAKAIEAEKKKKKVLYEVRVETGTGELDMTIANGIRQQTPGKDIARVENEDGTKTYVIGPFADKDTADNLAGFIRAMGAADTETAESVKE